MSGPTTLYSDQLHAKKYRGEGESFREAMNRVASTLKDNDSHWRTLRDILLNMRFLPGGRIQSAIGATRSVTAHNCYVSSIIDDSFVEGPNSIMQCATEAAATMRMGGGIGYDFSTLRPRGSTIRKLQSQSSGPVSFMEIFDAVCRCTASSGHRRGAQMGILRIDHPDIEEFIHAKQNSNRLTGFNVSVAATDAFIQALKADASFDLMWEGRVHKTISATALWETIMRSTWDWAEPGVIFIDTINEMNNLWYTETISATNPCGEQPLPPHGACLLGSFNLVKYLVEELGKFYLDLDQLEADIEPVVRAMDNVVDAARYPLRTQELEAKRKRRMGLGITGLANALEACGHPYGSSDFLEIQDEIQKRITKSAYQASAQIADEKGSFPEYKPGLYGTKGFVSTLDIDTLDMISKLGIRNSHLTSIAPTGTISLCADNISSGIEPVFAHKVERTVMEFDGETATEVWDYGLSELQVHGKTSEEVTIDEHLGVLLTAQRNVDSSVSKTLNVPESTSWEDFKNIYLRAYEGGAKGCTTYKVGGKREGIIKKIEDASCKIDPKTGVRSCDD
jgi:ribonucleoside-diphosphate reductase alpha chain